MRLNAGDARGYAAIQKGNCSDGMSDADYPFSITLIDPQEDVFTGCCSRR